MPRRITGKEQIRSIQKSSKGEYAISIPIRLIRELKWQERQKVVVKKFGKGKILISDWKPRK